MTYDALQSWCDAVDELLRANGCAFSDVKLYLTEEELQDMFDMGKTPVAVVRDINGWSALTPQQR